MIVALRPLLRRLIPEQLNQVELKVNKLKYIRWNPLSTWHLVKAVAIQLFRTLANEYLLEKCLIFDLRNTSSENAQIGFDSPELKCNCLTQSVVFEHLGIILCQCVKVK